MNIFNRDYYYGKKTSNYKNYDSMNASKVFKTVISFVKKQKLNGRFLDAGCAFGFLMKEMSNHFEEVYGFDISEFAIEKAKINAQNANIKLIDIQKGLPYDNEMFDFIAALDILEHTNNFENSFAKLFAILKKGGYMVIRTPLNNKLRKYFGFVDRDITHISVPSEKDLKELFRKYPVEIIKKRVYIPTPINLEIPHIPGETEIIIKKHS
jgi:2-polyprenyl-3-methyl-5-hydroxy-6-metoxy-1,4-benzoquinol methylase